ncbi:hypothetical protein [Shewanella benthica]|nr:hypothetical protein [Shewanella benthica]
MSKRYLPLVAIGSLFCIMLAFTLGSSILYALIMILVVAPILCWQKNHLSRKQELQV